MYLFQLLLLPLCFKCLPYYQYRALFLGYKLPTYMSYTALKLREKIIGFFKSYYTNRNMIVLFSRYFDLYAEVK